jgi:hypothetical protein
LFVSDRCTEIEKANRILLERMTEILAGPGQIFTKKSYGLPPVAREKARAESVGQLRSLNKGFRAN